MDNDTHVGSFASGFVDFGCISVEWVSAYDTVARKRMTRHESLRERRRVHRCRCDRAAVNITAKAALMTEQVAAEHDAIQNEQLADTVLTEKNTPDTIREWWA